MSELYDDFDADGEVAWVNETGFSDEVVERAVSVQYPELAGLSRWMDKAAGKNRPGGIFTQNKYVAPNTMFDEFRLAAQAVRDDDIVSNALETTENLAFRTVRIESGSDSPFTDDLDVWNQVKDDLNLTTKMREMWREMFTISQCYPAVVWHRKDYKVKSLTATGKKSKKVYRKLLVPYGITLLDPCKVLPIGNFMFGQERLLYIADKDEAKNIDETMAGSNASDMAVIQLFERRYEEADNDLLSRLRGLTGAHVDKSRLFLLNEDNVWRLTSTRPDYQVFADVRLRSVFELLDLKHNLREMDRADILGSLNAIIHVKKGSKDRPAKDAEIAQAGAMIRSSARLPIIISDERMEIEIITRKTDNTLRPERYNNLDSRITSRLFQILSTGNYSSGTATDTSPGLFKVISSTMEARRDIIRESLADNVFKKIYERNDGIIEEPIIRFYPRKIALDFDPHFAQFIYDLFIQGQVSHDTVLAEVDIELVEEASKRRREVELYGDVFDDPVPPGVGKSTGDVRADGRIGGGNKNGGGMNQDSFNSNPTLQKKLDTEK